MHKLKPIVARTPEELASSLGLSSVTAKEWQVQHLLVKRLKEITACVFRAMPISVPG